MLHRSKVLFIKYATYFQACWRTSRAPATQLLIFGFRSKMVYRDIGNGLANGLVFISNRLLLYLTGEVRLIAPCKHELGPGGSPENAAGVVVAFPSACPPLAPSVPSQTHLFHGCLVGTGSVRVEFGRSHCRAAPVESKAVHRLPPAKQRK